MMAKTESMGRPATARSAYLAILEWMKRAEASGDSGQKPSHDLLGQHFLPEGSIRAATIETGKPDQDGRKVHVKIEGVSFDGKDGIFDPHYFAFMRVAELGGVRFIADDRVKRNVPIPAAQRERFQGKLGTTIVMAAPEDSSQTGRHTLLRTIAKTDVQFHTNRRPGAPEDHRRATLTTKHVSKREEEVPVVALPTQTREDAIDFIVSIATNRVAFGETLPDLGITIEEFEHQLRRSLKIADAIHKKLHPDRGPVKAE